MAKISAQASIDTLQKEIESMATQDIEAPDMSRTPSESTFTRHTRSVNAIIKEVLLGIMCVLQLYMTFKLSK